LIGNLLASSTPLVKVEILVSEALASRWCRLVVIVCYRNGCIVVVVYVDYNGLLCLREGSRTGLFGQTSHPSWVRSLLDSWLRTWGRLEGWRSLLGVKRLFSQSGINVVHALIYYVIIVLLTLGRAYSSLSSPMETLHELRIRLLLILLWRDLLRALALSVAIVALVVAGTSIKEALSTNHSFLLLTD